MPQLTVLHASVIGGINNTWHHTRRPLYTTLCSNYEHKNHILSPTNNVLLPLPAYISLLSSHCARCKKYSKKENMWQVKCLPRPPTLSQRHMDLRVWSCSRHSDTLTVNRNPFGGFGAKGSKFGHFHYSGCWLLRQYFTAVTYLVVMSKCSMTQSVLCGRQRTS